MAILETNIRKKLIELVGGMRIADGFNFDWYASNPSAWDENLTDGYPFAFVEPGDETNLDEQGAVNGGIYTNDFPFTIYCRIDYDETKITEEIRPVDQIEDEIDKALQDLKRLFGNNVCLDDTVFSCWYTGSRRGILPQEKALGILAFDLLCRYRQQRREPEILR